MSYLHNLSAKLKRGENINISFMGGSVTEGYGATNSAEKGWPTLLCQKMQEEYGVTVNGNNKGIGGTCSYLANFRYGADVEPYNPDVLFIEFAVNDKYGSVPYEKVMRHSESLIGKAYAQNPYMDIVYVLTFDLGDKTNNYIQLVSHRDMADRYGLLSIKMSEYMYPHCKATGEDIQEHYIDGVHPNDHGYATYADIIFKTLKDNIHTDTVGDVLVKHSFLHSGKGLLLSADFAYCDEADIHNNNGWEFEKNIFSYLGGRYHGRLKADKPGSSFEFKFTGTDIGLLFGADVNRGIISISVDGREPMILDAHSSQINVKELAVSEHLPYGEHSVVITLLEEKNENSNSNFFEIGVFLVS